MFTHILEAIKKLIFKIKIRNQYRKRKKELQKKDPYLYK